MSLILQSLGKLCLLICIVSQFLYVNAAETLVPALFVLGDSLVDVGNNNYIKLSVLKANFPHNGVDYPSSKPTGRFSNGRNGADFLAMKLGFPQSPPPYLSIANQLPAKTNITVTGLNFASGGAGILDEISVQSLSLNKQIENLEKVYSNLAAQIGADKTLALFSGSLFAISIGSNDLISYFKSNSKLPSRYTPDQYLDYLITTFKSQLQKLYNLGARKIVIAGVGPIGCSPKQRILRSKTGDCIEEENNLTIKYNAALTSLMKDNLTYSLPGLKYAITNTYGLMSEYIQNPSANGFKEVRSACCGAGKLNAEIPCIPLVKFCVNRKEYVFWDLYHPTEIVSQMTTDVFFDGSPTEIFPINVKQLIFA